MAVPASRAVRTEGTTRWLSLAWPIVVAVLLIGITGVRLVDLELDPPFTKRIGDVSDEGYWAHNARLKALTGAFVQDPFNQALTTAPLYTAINALVFSLLGVSLGTARLVSAVAGVFTLLAGAGVIARTTGNRRWAAAFVAVLGVNDLFFAYNRIGLVEPTLNLFVFMAFLAFYQGLGSSRLWWFAASGACFGFAVLTKATGVYVLLAFLLAFAMELIVWRTVSARAFAAWVAGMGLPGVAGLTVAWLGFRDELLKFVDIYAAALIAQRGVYYKAVALVFNPLRVLGNEFVASLSVALLLLLLLARFAVRSVPVERLERVSIYWLVGGFLTCAVVPLQADRRYWGLLVPLAIIVSRLVVAVLGGDRPPANAREATPRSGAVVRGIIWYVATYASATIVAALGAMILGWLGTSYRLGLLQLAALIASGGMAAVMLAVRGPRATIGCLIIAPLLAHTLQWNAVLLWPLAPMRREGVLVVFAVFALVAGGGLLLAFRRAPHKAVLAAAAVYAVWNVAVVGVDFAWGGHTVRDTARRVEATIKATDSAAGRYRVFGKAAHQLVLEGTGLPLFFVPAREFLALNREFLEYLPPPRFYLHGLGAQPLHGLTAAVPQLPTGMTGQVLDRYCLYPTGDLCRMPILLVNVTGFDVAAVREQLEREARRKGP